MQTIKQIFYNRWKKERGETLSSPSIGAGWRVEGFRSAIFSHEFRILLCSAFSVMAVAGSAKLSSILPVCDSRHSPLPTLTFHSFLKYPVKLAFTTTRLYKPLTIMASALHSSKEISSTHFDNTLPTKDVLEIWRKADAVCFDVDSTVCLDEGIDELADFCGAGQAVAEWTSKAMSGSVPFEEALAARLSLFNPSLSQLNDFLEKRPPRISPGIAELIMKLKSNKTDVYLISGGFRQMINPVAVKLGIPLENIFANKLLFGSNGEFLGFDTSEPTSRSGGKATAVEHIRKHRGYKAMIMVGDGATDLEARKPGGADLFICYGGVQLRESVATKADWLVFNFQDLLNSLE